MTPPISLRALLIDDERLSFIRLHFDTLGADCDPVTLAEDGQELLEAYDATLRPLAEALQEAIAALEHETKGHVCLRPKEERITSDGYEIGPCFFCAALASIRAKGIEP